MKAHYYHVICILLLMVSSVAIRAQSKPSKFYLGKGPEVPIKTNAILRYSNMEVELKSLHRMDVTFEYVITILDNEGVKFGHVVWYYDDFTKITEGNIWVYDPLGNILDRVKINQMTDMSYTGSNFYDDQRVKYYRPHQKKAPYTVHYKYKKVISETYSLPAWYPQEAEDIYVEEASYQLINSSPLNYRTYIHGNEDSILVIETPQNNPQMTIFSVKDILSFDMEKYGPRYSEQVLGIHFPLESFQVDGYHGQFDNWENYGQWIHELNQGRQDLPIERQQFIKSLTDTIADPKSKARAIYKWMQSQTRYVSIQLGIGGAQTSTAYEVDEKKYGDCKALSNYTMALLKIADIEAYYTLVGAGEKPRQIDIKEKYDQFNHVILCLPMDGDTIWLECTSQELPFGYIGSFTDDRYVLLIKDHNSQIVKTKNYDENDNYLGRSTYVKLNNDGGGSGHFSAQYHNIEIEERIRILDESMEDQKDYIYDRMAMNGFHISDLNYQFVDSIHPIIHEDIEFSIRKIATTTSTKMFVPILFYKGKQTKIRKDKKRVNEIILRKSYTKTDTVVYDLPEGFTLASLPKTYDLNTDFGSYQSVVNVEPQKVTYIRKEIGLAGSFPANRFEDFRNYKNAIIQADKTTMVLVQDQK